MGFEDKLNEERIREQITTREWEEVGNKLSERLKRPTTDSTMPFKCPTEPAGAFKLESGTPLPCETNRSPGAS